MLNLHPIIVGLMRGNAVHYIASSCYNEHNKSTKKTAIVQMHIKMKGKHSFRQSIL